MYRIHKLLKLNRKIFHTSDLAILWGITNANTLHTTIKRYVEKGILISLQKGLYATVPIAYLDPWELGLAAIHRFGYISTETVLAQAGWISQLVYPITIVSGCARRFTLNNRDYLVRQLQSKFLYVSAGVIQNPNGSLIATAERALADLLYFNPNYHFDARAHIDGKLVKLMQKEVGYI